MTELVVEFLETQQILEVTEVDSVLVDSIVSVELVAETQHQAVLEVIDDSEASILEVFQTPVEIIEVVESGPAGPAGATGPEGPEGTFPEMEDLSLIYENGLL